VGWTPERIRRGLVGLEVVDIAADTESTAPSDVNASVVVVDDGDFVMDLAVVFVAAKGTAEAEGLKHR
jgi:hypothetical protein